MFIATQTPQLPKLSHFFPTLTINGYWRGLNNGTILAGMVGNIQQQSSGRNGRALYNCGVLCGHVWRNRLRHNRKTSQAIFQMTDPTCGLCKSELMPNDWAGICVLCRHPGCRWCLVEYRGFLIHPEGLCQGDQGHAEQSIRESGYPPETDNGGKPARAQNVEWKANHRGPAD